jgi:hypothetical protein
MDDINNMFGKPMDFVRTKRLRKQDKAPESKREFGGFSILSDDDLEHQEVQLQSNLSGTSRECDLLHILKFCIFLVCIMMCCNVQFVYCGLKCICPALLNSLCMYIC